MSSPASRYDVAVIGAGPAGMAAASEAARGGLSVGLFDEQAAPGGQIYRSVEDPRASRSVLGAEYAAGAGLVEELRASGAQHLPGAAVWEVTAGREIGVSLSGGGARLVGADAVIIATGAMERPFPVPGWTLPGVMTAGAAQILLKTSGQVLEGAVFVGQGPLLYLVAAQYLRTGVEVRGIVDTTAPANRLAALPHLPGAWLAGGQLRRGLAYLREIRRSGVKTYTDVSRVEVVGEDEARGVRIWTGRRPHTLAAAHVLLHQGVVPNVNLSRATGCEHAWDHRQLAWRVVTDPWGASSLSGIYVAGDGARIAGARAAPAAGRLAALDLLSRRRMIDPQACLARAEPLRRTLRAERRLRAFLDELYRPLARFRVPPDEDVLVCRCEEITAGEIRRAAALGCVGPNQLKSHCRAGMGACQGRQCALTVTELIAEHTGRDPSQVGDFRRRPPVKPLRLGDLAALAAGGDVDPDGS